MSGPLAIAWLVALPPAGAILLALLKRHPTAWLIALVIVSVYLGIVANTPTSSFELLGVRLTLAPLPRLFMLAALITLGMALVHSNASSRLTYSAIAISTLSLSTLALLIRANLLLAAYLLLGSGLLSAFGVVLASRGRALVGRRYLTMVALGGTMLLIAALTISSWETTGSVAMLRLALAFLVAAIGLLCGVFPFHFWSPSLAEETSPETAGLIVSLISATALAIVLGALHETPWLLGDGRDRSILLVGGTAAAVATGLLAIGEPQAMRLLALLASLSFTFALIGMADGSPTGLAGTVATALLTGPALLLSLIGLTLLRIGAESDTGSLEMRQINGMAWRHPLGALGFAVGGLTLVGFPIFGGFAGRFLVYSAISERHPLIILMLVGANALAFLALGRFLHQLFSPVVPAQTPSRPTMRAVALIVPLSLASLALGLYPAPLLEAIMGALAATN